MLTQQTHDVVSTSINVYTTPATLFRPLTHVETTPCVCWEANERIQRKRCGEQCMECRSKRPKIFLKMVRVIYFYFSCCTWGSGELEKDVVSNAWNYDC